MRTGKILNISVFALLSSLCVPSVHADSIQLTTNSQSPIISIWGGAREAIALKQDGSVWTWGHNVGEIGNGNQIDQALPFQVLGPGGVGTLNSVKLIMGGEDSNAAVTSDGSLWTWGLNGQGQLGIGSRTNIFTPVKVPTLNSVISLGGRARHYLAIISDGTVWGWGSNLHGALGSACSISPCLATTPVLIPGVNNPIMVTAGQGFSAALLQDHTVMTWGSALQLGTGSVTDSTVPVRVPGLTHVVSISAGWQHMLAVKDDGTVWTWGSNYWSGAFPGYGMLGNGTANNSSVPRQVIGLPNNIIQASGGDNFSAVLAANGDVWTFGANRAGQLGNGDPNLQQQLLPVKVIGLTNVKYITARDFHAQAIKSDGTVWSWGSGVQGELGMTCTPMNILQEWQLVGLPPPGYCRNSNIPVETLWPVTAVPVNGACGSSNRHCNPSRHRRSRL